MNKLNEKASKVLSALLAMNHPITDTTDGKDKQVIAKTVNEIEQYRFITLTYFADEKDSK